MATRRRKSDGVDDLEQRVLAEVEKGKKSSDAEAVARAIEAFDLLRRLNASRDNERATRKKLGDEVIAAEQKLNEAVELEASSSSAKVEKLHTVVDAWQELKDKRSEKADAMAACRNERKALEQRIEELLDDATQLGLFSETIRDDLRDRGALPPEAPASTVPPHDPETGEVLTPRGDSSDDADDGDADEDDGDADPFKLEADKDEDDFEPWRPKA